MEETIAYNREGCQDECHEDCYENSQEEEFEALDRIK